MNGLKKGSSASALGGSHPRVSDDANLLLSAAGLPALADEDAILLHLVLLTLYQEGVKPTFSEIHYKLKEHRCSADVERNFLAYYLAQTAWYEVRVSGTPLPPSTAVFQSHLAAKSLKARARGSSICSPDGLRTRSFATVETVVLFRTTPDWFLGWVNPKDSSNPYSSELWLDLLEFFRNCTRAANLQTHFDGQVFKQTRYALAKALKENGPDSIRALRLGEIAHMVQLAIQEGFLCYEASTIQPSWTSFTIASMRYYKLNGALVEGAESECTRRSEGSQDSVSPSRGFPKQVILDTHSIADSTTAPSTSHEHSERASCAGRLAYNEADHCTLDELRSTLRDLLDADQQQLILLSQLRVMLQTRLGKTVTPWVLGYTKLSNLLVEKCSDICQLIRHGGRHVFVERISGGSMLMAGEKPKIETPQKFPGQLSWLARSTGLVAPISFGDHDNIFSETLDPPSEDWGLKDVIEIEKRYGGFPADFFLSPKARGSQALKHLQSDELRGLSRALSGVLTY